MIGIPLVHINQALAGAAARNIKQLRTVAGYSAVSTQAGGPWTRIYLTVNLTHYIDVLDADIAHFVDIGNGADPLGGTVYWINRDAQVIESRVQDAGDFLKGDVTSLYLDTSTALIPGGSERAIDPPSLGRAC